MGKKHLQPKRQKTAPAPDTSEFSFPGPGFGFHVWRNATAMMGIRRGGRDDDV